ncbi:DUF1392 family protein [Nostoc sp. FACHB-87]|uniref:DUF1392 family protein n=1 Tax=Nostocaceae TaxID=1162 RepID=UPI001689CD89|nr:MULTISPECIES: DUF1392 family protein [Nostocaceae]MBD2457710.1 DUF1392 family protein [Nostoc sp. FACHB-87]MBD2478827.1 DUF1392 family protein [Anabaena sp. FACHB-83]
MTCAIITLEKCWYLSPPWGQQMPSLAVNLSEKVYLTDSKTFGYCCGVLWQEDKWLYAIAVDRSITYTTKHEIIGTGEVKSTYMRKPAFVLGDGCANVFDERVMLRFDAHATKQRLILGIVLVNNAWFYVIEMISPALVQPLAAPARFPLVGEQDLIRVHV